MTKNYRTDGNLTDIFKALREQIHWPAHSKFLTNSFLMQMKGEREK